MAGGSFIMQGMFLALASVISRIIGLFYRIPLTSIIGKSGNDNYGTAFEIYNIVLIISSYSLPLAISKMVAARMSEGRVKETKQVLILGLGFAAISGGAAFLTVFLGADFFAGEILKTPYAAIALKALAPALLIVAFLGVLRGFFQGLGTMIPSAISQIIEQIINAVISIVAAYYLFAYGLTMSEADAAAYGAAGGTLGTLSGAAAALIFLIIVFLIYFRVFKKKLKKDKSTDNEEMLSCIKILILTIIPVLLSTTLYNISSIVNQGIFKNYSLILGYEPKVISEYWGVFTGQYRVLVNVPISISSAIAASIVPSLTTSFRQKNSGAVRNKIRLGLRFINIISFPCMVGLAVLSGPLMRLLFNDAESSSAIMLSLGSLSVIFFAISTLTNGILQGIDKMSKPVTHAAIALVLQAGLLYILMSLFDLNIYAVVIANIFYGLIMCFLNELSVIRYTGLKYSIKLTYVIPFLSSVIMGGFVFICYYLINRFSENNLLATMISIFAGVLTYYVFMLLFGGIREEDLIKLPKGRLLVKISKKIGLIR